MRRRADRSAGPSLRYWSGYKRLLGSREYLAFLLYGSCMVSMIYTFVTGAPYVAIDVLGVSPSRFGAPAVLSGHRLVHRLHGRGAHDGPPRRATHDADGRDHRLRGRGHDGGACACRASGIRWRSSSPAWRSASRMRSRRPPRPSARSRATRQSRARRPGCSGSCSWSRPQSPRRRSRRSPGVRRCRLTIVLLVLCLGALIALRPIGKIRLQSQAEPPRPPVASDPTR